jgi:hypothetical protein
MLQSVGRNRGDSEGRARYESVRGGCMNIFSSQTEKVKRHLEKEGSITPLEALYDYGCMRLSGRIYDLKKQGIKIKTEHERKGEKMYARYKLIRG